MLILRVFLKQMEEYVDPLLAWHQLTDLLSQCFFLLCTQIKFRFQTFDTFPSLLLTWLTTAAFCPLLLNQLSKVRKPLVANRCVFLLFENFIRFHLSLNTFEWKWKYLSTVGTKWTNGLKVKVSDSLDNVPNENVVTTGDHPTDQQT